MVVTVYGNYNAGGGGANYQGYQGFAQAAPPVAGAPVAGAPAYPPAPAYDQGAAQPGWQAGQPPPQQSYPAYGAGGDQPYSQCEYFFLLNLTLFSFMIQYNSKRFCSYLTR